MAALTASCGCNQVFGLKPTESAPQADAQYFDAAPDAALMCPPIGGTIAFGDVLHAIGASCIWFSSSQATQRQYSVCNQQISEAPIDGTFAPVTGVTAGAGQHLDLARISPDGTTLYVRRWDDNVANSRMLIYTRGTSGFSQTGEVTVTGVPYSSFITFSAPTSAPSPRMLLHNGASSDVLEIEIAANGVASLVHTYTPGSIGLESFFNAGSISVDGLRMMIVGSTPTGGTLVYADRASLDVPFGMPRYAQPLVSTSDLFFDEECTRLYFISGGFSSFWAPRIPTP